MEGLELRNYHINDFDKYYSLYTKALSAYSWEIIDTPDELRRSIFSTPFHKHKNHFLAFKKDELIGSAWAMLNPAYKERHGPYPYSNFLVEPAHRRKGVGSILLNNLKESFQEPGIQGIDAFVDERKKESSSFLKRHGFEKIGSGFIRMEHDLNEIPSLPIPDKFTIKNPDLPSGLDVIVENMNACCATLEDHKPYTREFIGTRPYIVDPNNHPGNFILEKGRETIGTVFSTLEANHEGNRRVVLGGIYAVGILNDHRRQGLGQLLVSKSMEWIKNMGAQKCYLYLSSSNGKAFRMYQKMGFEETERGYKYRLEFDKSTNGAN